jgi:hypothetical protein
VVVNVNSINQLKYLNMNEKFKARFDYLVERVEKEYKQIQQLNEEYDKKIQERMEKLSTITNTYTADFCKGTLERLMLYSKMPDGSGFKPLEGYETDFENANAAFQKCRLVVESLPNMLAYNIETLGNLIYKANELCLEQCSTEVQESQLNEKHTRKCINTCLDYKLANLSTVFEIVSNEFDEKEKLLNNTYSHLSI